MKKNNSGCLTAAVTGFSRLFLLFAWIARPVAFDAAFGSWIWPCLGFLVLPFTTLMYLILITNGSAGIGHRLALAHPGGGGRSFLHGSCWCGQPG